MEEFFFVFYHMEKSWEDTLTMPVYVRRWMIDRFIAQRAKENEMMEKRKKK